MPNETRVDNILILGAGPATIGQTGEYDEAAVEACRTLRSLGHRVIAVDSNPAGRFTDLDIADVAYIEPLNAQSVTEVIAKENPNALIPFVGGQSALNLTRELYQNGVLEKYAIRVLGVDPETIDRCENRPRLQSILEKSGMTVAQGQRINSIDQAMAAAETLKYPLFIRRSYASGGIGSGLAYNREELWALVDQGLSKGPLPDMLIQTSLKGLMELEILVVRDCQNQIRTIGVIENIDPVGVHTGDSIGVCPPMTLPLEVRSRMESWAHQIIASLDICGAIQIQFAYDDANDRLLVIEINPRFTRTSAIIARTTGLSVARLATLVAMGIAIETAGDHPVALPADFTPPEDVVAVTIPLWAFDTYRRSDNRLDTQMRSVGSALGVGRTFAEALLKSVHGLNDYPQDTGTGLHKRFTGRSLAWLLEQLRQPRAKELFLIYSALKTGADRSELSRLTQIRPWFFDQIRAIVQIENEIRQYRGSNLPVAMLTRAKQSGFSDQNIAEFTDKTTAEICDQRRKFDLNPIRAEIPVVAGFGNVLCFSTYNGGAGTPATVEPKVLILGPGPNQIGSGMGLGYCGTHAALALHHAGYRPILVNPSLDSTSFGEDAAPLVYIDPVNTENVLEICRLEKPKGVLVQFGGRDALCKASELQTAGINVFGTPPQALENAQDRSKIRKIVRQLGIPQPQGNLAASADEALDVAQKIGFPIMVRSVLKSGTQAKAVIHDLEMLQTYLNQVSDFTAQTSLWIDRFLDNALEAEVEALADGATVFVPGVMEQIELAGIHTGDSACVIPTVGIPPKHIETIGEYTRLIAAQTGAVGLMNLQFAFYRNTVYLLDFHHGACRTVPLVSKAHDIALARLATQIQIGKSISELAIPEIQPPYFCVREAVFPFALFPETDPLLGPDMQSTGEVLGLAPSFGLAFYKAQEATQTPLPEQGTVLFTIAEDDKPAALEPARLFRDLGFQIAATPGTHDFLTANGIPCRSVRKLGFGRPDLLDAIKTGEVQLVVNTPMGRQSAQDSAYIRKSAVHYNVLSITTTAAATAAARGIAARRQGPPEVRSMQSYADKRRCAALPVV